MNQFHLLLVLENIFIRKSVEFELGFVFHIANKSRSKATMHICLAIFSDYPSLFVTLSPLVTTEDVSYSYWSIIYE